VPGEWSDTHGMSSVLGVVSLRGAKPSVDRTRVARMLEVMAPGEVDGSGYWARENALLATRRQGPPDDEQPLSTPDGRFHLILDGELHNGRELLEEGRAPRELQNQSDSEIVLWAFATWGPAAFARLHGTFAIAVYDSCEELLHLARDRYGIKSLYYHQGSSEFVFSSTQRALLAHPGIDAQPSIVMASAYLSTLRTTIDSHTLFHGVKALLPGERAVYDARNGELGLGLFHEAPPVQETDRDPESIAEEVRWRVEESVGRHLRGEEAAGLHLSGTLESAILADTTGPLPTWKVIEPDDAESEEATHHAVPLDSRGFAERWPRLVQELGLPLSLPGDVALHAVAEDLRTRGYAAALCSEGADEFFAGHEQTLQAAAEYCASSMDKRTGGRYQLDAAAWVPPSIKPHLLSALTWSAVEGDELLFDHYDESFRRCEQEVGGEASPLDAHLRFIRHNNLAGLLARLDSATIQSSVQWRAPFADASVAEFAESLPLRFKLGEIPELRTEGTTAVASAVFGKLALRAAWQERLPLSVCETRSRAFTLPFQNWVAELAWTLETSPFAKAFFADDARRQVASDPIGHWRLAWPMINLALWGDAWWS
jgi:asparagine synthase (glutamine-hydrolysing)